MKLSEFKKYLDNMDVVNFYLPNGKKVPAHFHVTEVGNVVKDFIDCGGTIRQERSVNFQLWSSFDIHHRLGAEKLKSIISISEEKIGVKDYEIEVEYQGDTIGKFGLDYSEGSFVLRNKQTDCLAKDNCGIPIAKPKVSLSDLTNSSCCAPESGCC